MIIAITGGAGALGSAVAKHVVGQGYRAALLDTPAAKARLDERVATLGSDKAVAITGDFAEAEAWSGALVAIEKTFGGRPTHAALIAGGWDGGVKIFEEKATSVFQKMMRMNTDTVHAALTSLLPAMTAAKSMSAQPGRTRPGKSANWTWRMSAACAVMNATGSTPDLARW